MAGGISRAKRIPPDGLVTRQMSRPAEYPASVIALCRGLFATGISAKRVSRYVGLSYETVRAWCYGWRCISIPPDERPLQAIQKIVGSVNPELWQALERDHAPSANVPAVSVAKPDDTPIPGSH